MKTGAFFISEKKEGDTLGIYSQIKEQVSTLEAAEHYGYKVSRNGMMCCPFHNDRTPSMKVDQNFICFGCQEKGDVIDFIFGEPDLCRTIGNLIWGGQYVPNEQVRRQMLSLSARLSDNMDQAKWPEFFRRIRSNVGIRLQREKQAEQENLAFMRAELKKMEAGNEGKRD